MKQESELTNRLVWQDGKLEDEYLSMHYNILDCKAYAKYYDYVFILIGFSICMSRVYHKSTLKNQFIVISDTIEEAKNCTDKFFNDNKDSIDNNNILMYFSDKNEFN